MSAVQCWQCGKDYPKSQVFDIPVFHIGFRIKWCFNCANKQLKLSDKIIKIEDVK